MRIAMIGQKGIPSRVGGVEIHVEEIAKRLVNKEYEVDVYCRKSYCENIYDKYQGISLKYKATINTKHLDAITYTFLSSIDSLFSNYDIIHYHALGPSTLSFIPRIFGKKVVCTVHGLDWQREKWEGFAKKYLKFGEYATAKFPNKTITVSNTLKEYYKKVYNKDVVFIPNGVDIPEIADADIIEREYGLTKNSYILFLARLVPEKGVHYLIDAYNNINTEKKLVIAGGSSHTDDYVSFLKERANNNPNIIFTGFVTGNKLKELYSNAYIYVLPSEIEGLPISLLEAMSYKQCCLVSDIPENMEVIEGQGYTFSNKNVLDLTDKLHHLISNEDDVNRIKANVQDYVKNNYNWDRITELTEQVYRSIVGVK